MELKTFQPQDIRTLDTLTEAIEYYREIQEEISRLQTSKDLARESILAKFRETGLRRYDTLSGLRARVDTRAGHKYIDPKEAAVLLPPDLFDKLLKVGETITILSVRPIKSEEESAYQL